MIVWKNICLSPQATVLEAMKIIDKGRVQFAIVVDDDFHLLGTITDGDIRRAFLSGLQAHHCVDLVMNRNPTVVYEGLARQEIYQIMRQQNVLQIPVLNKNKKLVRIDVLDEILQIEKKSNHVILMAGGLGSRLGELTSNCPKPMLKIGTKPILETIIDNLRIHGFEKFFISVNYKSEMIQNYFQDGKKFKVEIEYLKEEAKLGTAGAISLYSQNNDEPFIVMNADLLTRVNVSKMLEAHIQNTNALTVGVRQYEYQMPYGVVNTANDCVTGIEEKPVYSHSVNGGVYILNPKMRLMVPHNTYYDMPTLIQNVLVEKMKVGAFPIEEYWLDIGRKADLEKANSEFEVLF